jgi:DnaJ-class molecular chaperone
LAGTKVSRIPRLDTYTIIKRLYQEAALRANFKRKNYYLDEAKIRRARRILGAKTETETIDAALDLVVFKREILRSLEKVAGKGGVQKIF